MSMKSNKEQGLVVGFSSPSGGGKTALISKIAALLDDLAIISFDEYDDTGGNIHPQSYSIWLAEGADYNAWQTPRLAEDLKKLKNKQAITSPINGRIISPPSLILFDAPLGRNHHQTGQYIDLMVYIDTSLDVAMARRILRDCYCPDATPTDDKAESLRQDLKAYLEYGRAAYLEQDRQVKPKCDLILDGTLPLDELAHKVIEIIQTRE